MELDIYLAMLYSNLAQGMAAYLYEPDCRLQNQLHWNSLKYRMNLKKILCPLHTERHNFPNRLLLNLHLNKYLVNDCVPVIPIEKALQIQHLPYLQDYMCLVLSLFRN